MSNTSNMTSQTPKDSDAASVASNSTFASTITLIKEKLHRNRKASKDPKPTKDQKEQPQESPQEKLMLADVATGAHLTRTFSTIQQKQMLKEFILMSK